MVQKTWILHNSRMSLEWLQLRPWDGSQQTAFEKLSVQLLSREPVPAGSVFIPKSAPDAGIEGYWHLKSGAEWGLQAKFFLAALEESQWKQLDKSIERSLDRHPQLTRYIVAIPQDRSDPRVPNQQWFADKWNARVQVWSEWAHQRKMSVAFEYWGETELLNRLTEEKNRGLVLFWFNKHRFSNEWMSARVNETIRNVGPRYTPEINVELPVAFALEGLGRTLRFADELNGFRTQLQQHMRKAFGGRATETAPAKWSKLKTSLQEVVNALASHADPTETASPLGVIASFTRSANELLWSCIEAAQTSEAAKTKDKGFDARKIDSMFGNEVRWLRELAGVLHTVGEFLRSDAARCFNAKTLLLIGGAGTGKTHLFCDVALQRLRKGLPTLLLLGTQFEYGEPLAQIPTRILGTELSRDDFLLALDAAGEAAGHPALLMIDALNEGEGHLLWMDFLGGMLEALGRYRHIAIAISVRDSYTDIVIPDGLDDSVLPEVTHFGFAGHELIATHTFFDYYGLKTPSIPLLNPEFDNPLFLKLFCKGLVNMGRTEVPRGIGGLSSIFEDFIESVNIKLAKPHALDFDASDLLLQKAVGIVVDEMDATGRSEVDRSIAKNKINALLPHRTGSQSLYTHLISEDIIYEDRRYNGSTNNVDHVVRLAFERFADHAVAKRLLARISTTEELSREFEKGRLGSSDAKEWRLRASAGIIEALSLQVPEKFADELISVCPILHNSRVAAGAFLRMIPWRDPASIKEKTCELLNQMFHDGRITERDVLRVLLLVAASPEHPWNSDFLHKNLMRREMSIRDATWSIFVFYDYEEEDSPTNRLINWAASESKLGRFDEDSVKLASVALCWMLSTSHRFARDRATKALIALLTPYPNVLVEILATFENVNDPYIRERVYCVAYGCAMRTTNSASLRMMAEKVYATVFDKRDIPAHLLLRDYARGVIEIAHARSVELSFDLSKVRPPYGSVFIPAVFAPGELNGWSAPKGGSSDANWAKRHIYNSVMGHDDFARYVIGTNSGSFEWSKHRMKPKRRSRTKSRNWEDRFDLRVAQDWIMRRIIDLDWKTELHGEFDSRVPNRGREAHKPERIGKKYQWIAYHEFLGRVADNFEFTGETWSNRIERYDGPWQVGYVRDIDPSCLIQATNINSATRCWWQPLTYAWDASLNHEEWLRKTDDLPRFDSGFQVLDGSSQEWHVLESYYHFDQPQLLALDKERETSLPERQIWAQVRSYLVHEKDFGRLTQWAHKQDFMGRWMPESHGAGRLFLGEHFWSPAFKYFEQPYYQREGWTREGGRNALPVSVLVTSDPYSWEKGLDCSIRGSVSLLLPCHAIVQQLNLKWHAVPGQYLSGTVVVTQDPSVFQEGPTALLIRKDYLLEFLREQKLRLLWTVLAEKNVYLDDREDWPGRLEMSGSYGLDVDGTITGNLRTKLVASRNLG